MDSHLECLDTHTYTPGAYKLYVSASARHIHTLHPKIKPRQPCPSTPFFAPSNLKNLMTN